MYLISYDIEKNNLRTRIGNKLIEFGLYRIQYSVYLGYLKMQDYNELLHWLKFNMKTANLKKDSVIVITLEKPQVKNMEVIGVQKLDISEISGEKDTLIF